MDHVSLTVKGMSCSHCVNTIETHVGKLNGVSSVKVDLGEGKVDVNFNPDQVTVKQIIKTIEDQGYDVAG